jgi:hypothetical protein
MKLVKLFERAILCALALAVSALAYQCAGQTPLRINTQPGMIEIYQSDNPDEICLRFGEQAGEVKAEYLQYAGETLQKRLASAAKMADDAAVPYEVFLKENQIEGTKTIRQYFAKCCQVRRQFLAVIPERSFVELEHLTQYFAQ